MHLWPGLITALLLAGTAAPAASAGDAQNEAAAEGEELGIRLGAGYSLWLSDLKFRCESPTQIVESDFSSLSGVEIFGQFEVVEEWSFRLGGDFLFGVDTRSLVGSLGAVYTPRDILDPPLEASFRAGLLLGSFEIKDVEGDFDPAVGVEAGLGITHGLDEYLEGLMFQAEVMFRYLKFDFDRDATVTASDDSVGGFGVRLSAGFTYRF